MVGGTFPDLSAGYGAEFAIARSTASSNAGTPEEVILCGAPRKEPSGNKLIVYSTVGLSGPLSDPKYAMWDLILAAILPA